MDKEMLISFSVVVCFVQNLNSTFVTLNFVPKSVTLLKIFQRKSDIFGKQSLERDSVHAPITCWKSDSLLLKQLP